MKWKEPQVPEVFLHMLLFFINFLILKLHGNCTTVQGCVKYVINLSLFLRNDIFSICLIWRMTLNTKIRLGLKVCFYGEDIGANKNCYKFKMCHYFT